MAKLLKSSLIKMLDKSVKDRIVRKAKEFRECHGIPLGEPIGDIQELINSKVPEYSLVNEMIASNEVRSQYNEEGLFSDWYPNEEEREIAETVIPCGYNNQYITFLTIL